MAEEEEVVHHAADAGGSVAVAGLVAMEVVATAVLEEDPGAGFEVELVDMHPTKTAIHRLNVDYRFIRALSGKLGCYG